MAIRLIALDIDGTLLDSRGQVPEANRAAVAAAAARGVEVVLVTGRRFAFARPIADGLGAAPTFIAGNGTLVRTAAGETLARHLLPCEVARRVLDGTRDFRAETSVVFDRPREDQVICERADWHDPTIGPYLRKNREYISEVAPLEACLIEDPLQLVYAGPVGRMRALFEALHRLNGGGAFGLALTEYLARDLSLVDVVRHGCSKGRALAAYARGRGYAPAEIMAVGDNLNDVDMLEAAGVPVVMGNAVAGLKARGWPVTATNDEAGVARAIAEYLLRA